MRYLALWRPQQDGVPRTQDHYVQMGRLIEDMTNAGVLQDTGGWDPNAPAILVKNSGGKVTITDGPYTEAKELVGGFAIFQVQSRDEAVKWGSRFIEIAGDGVSEMREIPQAPLKG
jgi:hypothetical protein